MKITNVIFLFLQLHTFLSSTIIIKTNHAVLRKKVHNISKWQKWIKEEDTHDTIFNLNPSFLNATKTQNFYTVHLTPMQFQGLEIQQQIDFNIFTNNCTLELKSCSETLKNTISGDISGIFSFVKITNLDVHNILSLNKFGDGILSNEEFIELTVELPNVGWIPGVSKSIQFLGSKTISDRLKKNMNCFIDKVVEKYNEDFIPKHLDPWVDWIH